MDFSVCGVCKHSQEEPLIQFFHPNTVYSKQLSGYLEIISGVKVTPANPPTGIVCVTCYDIAYDLYTRHQKNIVNIETEVKTDAQHERKCVDVVDLKRTEKIEADIAPKHLSKNVQICHKYLVVLLNRNDVSDWQMNRLKNAEKFSSNSSNYNINKINKIKVKSIKAVPSDININPWKVKPFLPTVSKKKTNAHQKQKQKTETGIRTRMNRKTNIVFTRCLLRNKNKSTENDNSKTQPKNKRTEQQFLQSLFKKHLKHSEEQSIQTDDFLSKIKSIQFENILPELKKHDISFKLSTDTKICIQKKMKNPPTCMSLQYWTFEESIDVYKPTINLRKRNKLA